MLPFEEQVVADLLEDPNGGLVVLSSGLPLASLAATLLLHLHHQSPSFPSGGCFLILSAPDPLKDQIRRRLLDSQLLQVHDVVPDVPAAHRRALYSSANSAALFLTPRVLAADLLTSHLSPSRVGALLLLAAHRASDTSPDAFIARLLRQRRLLPVYAFSDRPHAMVAGFAKAERAMKTGPPPPPLAPLPRPRRRRPRARPARGHRRPCTHDAAHGRHPGRHPRRHGRMPQGAQADQQGRRRGPHRRQGPLQVLRRDRQEAARPHLAHTRQEDQASRRRPKDATQAPRLPSQVRRRDILEVSGHPESIGRCSISLDFG